MMLKNNYLSSKNGLVLTGGGARAAYQVGALSAIAKFIPRHHPIPFSVITGTSAGAINSTALACYASCFHLGVKKLEWVWKNLKTHKVYYSDFMRTFGHILGGITSGFQANYANKTARSLLNNEPLHHLLVEVIDYGRLEKNLANNMLLALSITASNYSNGHSISFYQSNHFIAPWQRAKRSGIPYRLNNQLLMASSAIPLIFPSVNIDQQHYGDGSIHQLSPLSPAVHLGAENILIIGVEQPKNPKAPLKKTINPPTLSTVAGHLLDSIFTDTLESDLERMARINQSLKTTHKPEGLKHINSLVLNPSENFNAIAAEHYSELPMSIKLLLKTIGVHQRSHSSLVSYLLFEKKYCRQLIQLGFNDTMEKEKEIRSFLSL